MTDSPARATEDHHAADTASSATRHQQLDLESLVEPVQETAPASEPPKPGKWSMTWRPESDTTSDASQHPAARVARENAAAAAAQPAIPVTPDSSVEPEPDPPAPETAETQLDPRDDQPRTSATEEVVTETMEASKYRMTRQGPRPNPLNAAGWLLAVGLIVAWFASSSLEAPSNPTPNTANSPDVLARPLGVVPDVAAIDQEDAIETSESRLDQLETETGRLRSDLALRDSELQNLRSTTKALADALEEAADDAAYSARERILLHEELEAALSLLEAADPGR